MLSVFCTAPSDHIQHRPFAGEAIDSARGSGIWIPRSELALVPSLGIRRFADATTVPLFFSHGTSDQDIGLARLIQSDSSTQLSPSCLMLSRNNLCYNLPQMVKESGALLDQTTH